MGQMNQHRVREPASKLFKTAPLRAARTQSMVDYDAELSRLRIELARTKQELNQLRDATAQMLRSLI